MTRHTQHRRPHPIDCVPSFEEDYLDIDHWPQRWQVESRDQLPGQRMLETFKPFLFWLLEQRLSRKTLRVHRDHLCDLGGEIIRQLNLQQQLRRRSIMRVLMESLGEDGGPLIYPRKSEPEQRSFDSTCRKLHRFLLDSQRS